MRRVNPEPGFDLRFDDDDFRSFLPTFYVEMLFHGGLNALARIVAAAAVPVEYNECEPVRTRVGAKPGGGHRSAA